MVDGGTVSPQQAITLDGHVFSQGSAGLFVDGSTRTTIPEAQAKKQNGCSIVMTTAGQTLTIYDPADQIGFDVVNGVSLSRGQATVILGQISSRGLSVMLVKGIAGVTLPVATVFDVGSQTCAAYAVPGISGLEVVNGITMFSGQLAFVASHTFAGLSNGQWKTALAHCPCLPMEAVLAPARRLATVN